MRNFLRLTAITLLAWGVAGCSSSHQASHHGRVTHVQSAKVIDVRTPEEYASGHVQGAVNIPVSEIETRISEVAKSKDTPLAVHCRSGGRSARAASKLRQMGYTNVKDLGSYANAKATVEGANRDASGSRQALGF